MNQDEEHLKLLSIFHYIAGGIVGFFAILHLIIGIATILDCSSRGLSPPFGLIFYIMMLGSITLGWSLAICLIISGRCLTRRKCYKFCFATACVSCLLMPYGTVLGVFTIIELMRPTVKKLFKGTSSEYI
jgi:hypothetical protein